MKRLKAFTLIELSVIMVIIGILSLVLIPILVKYPDTAKRDVCKATRATLLRDFRVQKVLGYEGDLEDYLAEADQFHDGKTSCPAEGTYYVIGDEDGYAICCSVHDDIVRESTYMSAYTSSYDFTTLSFDDIDEYIIYGGFSLDGVLTNERGGENRIFFPMSGDNYDVTADITLDGSNGYALLIESDVEEDGSDSGYAIQFDRGYGIGLFVVRPREDGSEDGAIYRTDPRDVLDEVDDEWWNLEHEIKIEVRDYSETEKSALVYVDGVLMNEDEPYILDRKDAYENTQAVGFRTWGSSHALIDNLTIEDAN